MLFALSMSLCATGGCKQGPWSLWESYSSRFIDAQGRVIDPQGDARTTSEGQAYAMFFALADGDRPMFDRLLMWTQDNLAQGDLATHLPAWLWGKRPDGSWKTIDPNPASDADVWMAYTLVQAGRLWKNPAYTSMGRGMMALIARNEVANLPGFGLMLLPGAAGFQHGTQWTLNPSYEPLFLFEGLAAADPSGPWGQIATNIPRFLSQSSVHGWAMDWVGYQPDRGFYPASVQVTGNKQPAAPGGSYDAIRVYLWAGMINPADQARAPILNALPAMGVYLSNHDAPPDNVNDQGIPSGKDGPVGFSAAVLPYLRALPNLSKASAAQSARMTAQRDQSTGLYGKDFAYYDQNLVLFATGFIDGRFSFGRRGELKVGWERR
ncbi:MAG TPA: cellulose synthase complex periplasmic endoglucanase BcsZ [Terracidiphilus sp.]|nr:cellulose synthase complex periplasmic endoglucanase BcsZ [Terracidiphilus sp.]